MSWSDTLETKGQIGWGVSGIWTGLAPNILSLSDVSLREETRVIYEPHSGFLVTMPGGVWRFRRSHFGQQYLDAWDFQHFDIAHGRVDHHNSNCMLRELIPGYDLAPRWGVWPQGEHGQEMESSCYLGALWALRVQLKYAM